MWLLYTKNILKTLLLENFTYDLRRILELQTKCFDSDILTVLYYFDDSQFFNELFQYASLKKNIQYQQDYNFQPKLGPLNVCRFKIIDLMFLIFIFMFLILIILRNWLTIRCKVVKWHEHRNTGKYVVFILVISDIWAVSKLEKTYKRSNVSK